MYPQVPQFTKWKHKIIYFVCIAMVRRPKLVIYVMSQPKILPICGLLEDSYSKNIVRISRQVLLK
jgi:hypothetical protein